MSDPIWLPTAEYIEKTRLYQWMNKLGFRKYEDFYNASINDISWFWGEVEKELSIPWQTPYRSVLNLDKGFKWPEWFVDGQINVVSAALDKWMADPKKRNQPALIYENEIGKETYISYKELYGWVNRVAVGLKKLGVKRGDRIGIFLPMIPEAAVTILAAAKIGAIFTVAFSGFAAEAVAIRFKHAGVKILVTADGFIRRGNVVRLKEVADQAADMVPSIEKVVVASVLDRETTWFKERDISFKDLEVHGESVTEHMNSDDPFMIIYTSGTTARPKGTVHTHGEFPLKAALDMGYIMDLKPEQVIFWITDMGWIMGPMVLIGSLYNGATMLLYNGSPDTPNTRRVWDIVNKYKVNFLGLSPTFVRAIMASNNTSLDKETFPSLKGIGSTGEPWNPEPWHWLFNKICKTEIPIFNISGGTEIAGGIIGTTNHLPIKPITFNTALLGMDADVYNHSGKPATNKVGELIIKQPWVGMTKGFWNEPERYEVEYWKDWDDVWIQGDATVKDDQGYWIIQGRSDDTMNIAGKRIGPAEMESVLMQHSSVKESAVIGIPDSIKGETSICFIVLNESFSPSEKLKTTLLQLIAEQLGRPLQPKTLYFISDLPKTRSQKIMRRIIRSTFLNKDLGDLSSLENPESVDLIKQLKK